MEANLDLLAADPSRYTVYQLLDYIKDKSNIKLIQRNEGNLFLIKTEPYLDSLYNYVHILNGSLESSYIPMFKYFFSTEAFRVKTLADKTSSDILLNNGFTFRDSSYAMSVPNLENLTVKHDWPKGVKVEVVATEESWQHFRLIFAEAFSKTIDEFDKKFNFLKKFVLDQQERHFNFFLLYENGIPVSSGGYYAFDKFSIENIGTLKIARGRGYASVMISFLLQEARLLGYNEACLVGSEEAASIYQKFGFEILVKNNTFIK
jgi:GNAT superfamily N-acetyltransferase